MEQTEIDQQTGDKPILNIVGEKIALGPIQKSMLSTITRWENDFAVSIMSGGALRPIHQEHTDARYEQEHKAEQRQHIAFAIYERSNLRFIGTAALRHLSSVRRTAEYGISIGEKDCWGRGYGTEATLLVLDYAFTVLGLHTILLSTYAYNERAIRSYTRAGFRVVGHWREAARLGDQVYDIVYMDCLSTEFHNPSKRVIDLP